MREGDRASCASSCSGERRARALLLLLFPLEVSGISGVPGALDAVVPLIFVSTLAIPVLRYQLWSGNPVPRRRRVGPLVSRRTLIEAQEEERRRLRRDLHDGLGPLLTGLRLNLDAVQAQLTRDPAKALEHLTTAREALAEVISDLRGLVYGLRPPALDELGLVGSLRLHLASLVQDSRLEVVLEADGQLAPPAAVEVAIYRSASEAVTNVVRHSTAQHCRVSVATERAEHRPHRRRRRSRLRHLAGRNRARLDARTSSRARRYVHCELRTVRVHRQGDLPEEVT